MRRIRRVGRLAMVWCCVAFATWVTTLSAQDDGADLPTQPLQFLEPLIGTWVPAPSWLDENPGMESLVMLQLEWGPARRSIRYRAGLATEAGDPFTEGTILWDPAARRAAFVSSQGRDGLFYEGYYELLEGGDIRRVYTVYYPNRGPLDFRETFMFVAPDTIDWLTEWRPESFWVPRRGGGDPEARAVRAPATASDALRALDRIVGSWTPDPTRIPDRMAEWRRENGITDEATVFEWGTGDRWIEFAERREQNGTWSVEGSGLIAYDPYRRVLTYVEHTDSGVTLRGTLVTRGENTIQRHYRSYAPNGTLAEWIDTWRWDDQDESCFEWTTVRVTDSETDSWPSYWMCRNGP